MDVKSINFINSKKCVINTLFLIFQQSEDILDMKYIKYL